MSKYLNKCVDNNKEGTEETDIWLSEGVRPQRICG